MVTKELSNSITILKEFMKIKGKTQEKFLNDLESYCFHEIFKEKDKFGQFGNGKTYEDGDCTKLAYAIYSIIWSSKMKELGILEFTETNFGKYKNSFSGDTINTFYTLFGKTDKAQERVLDILGFDENQKEIYDKFKKLYQTIGNFYFLPKNTINRRSINSYRGIKWNDFFDIFLNKLKNVMNDNNSCEAEFVNLYNENRFFFDKVKPIDNFIHLFYLEDKKEHYNYLDNFVFDDKDHLYRHDMLPKKNKDSYKKFAIDYMTKANELIEKRSRVIIRELRKSLKEFNISL